MKFLFAVVSVYLCGIPIWTAVVYGTDFTHLANESLAYRYFLGERILSGDDSPWVWNGHLTSVAQHMIFITLDAVDSGSHDLHARLNAFAYGTLLLNLMFLTTILSVGAFHPRLEWIDRLSVGLVAVVPPAGFNATAIVAFSDYHMVCASLTALVVLIFLLEWRREPTNRFVRHSLVVGLLCGLLAGNKISLVILAAPLTILLLVRRCRTWLSRAVALLLVALSSLASLYLIILAFSAGSVSRSVHVITRCVMQFLSPGFGDPDFWTHQIVWTSWQYNYTYAFFAALVILCVSLVFVIVVGWRTKRLPQSVICVLSAMLLFAGLLLFLYKRSAGTALFEVATGMVALSAVALQAIAITTWSRRVIISGMVSLLALIAAAEPLTHGWRDLHCRSRDLGALRWQLYDDIQAFAGTDSQIIVYPDNNHHHEGVHELLIKGMSIFPSWEPSPIAREIARRYLPLDEYRTEQGGNRPNQIYPSDVVVVWFERIDMPPLEERYTSIHDVRRRSVEHARWELSGTNVVAHACRIPPGSETTFTIDLDVFQDAQGEPVLVWNSLPGYPPEMWKLEVRHGTGEFEYIAHLPKWMVQFPLGSYGFDPSQSHTFRLSCVPANGAELCTATVESPAKVAAKPAEAAGL